ncbi:uncharacterized protein LOC134947545 [Pseudophryne corroboree]|uniref:uncharacterized protein LOC134947545 n=1 Tax=Pseudophryne corroboree TaxID=495146 RepID=UPI003081D64C
MAGRLNGRSTEPRKQGVAQAPYLPTNVQRSETNILHLYLPTAESYEEDESETARSKKHTSEYNDKKTSKNILKVDPRKPLPPHPPRRVTDKWTRLPCKEAVTTAKVSVQFGGNDTGLHISSSRRCLLDSTKNRLSLLEDSVPRNCTQRPASNIGYRLGSYYTYKIAGGSEYGLNVWPLNINNEKSKGTLLSNQCLGLEKGESFIRRTRDHPMIEKSNVRCKSQPDILDVKERGAYI